jgi:hypothetical protein
MLGRAVRFTDDRILSVSLWWASSVHNGSAVEREKYAISRDRRMIILGLDHCAINDELRIDD